jgi:hypothetical protein
MTVYHHNLNFKINPLKNNIIVTDLPKIVNNKKVYRSPIFVKDHINPEMLDFLAELNIFSNHCELFYSIPNLFSNIHVDIKHGDFTKLNWVYGGTNSVMNWYRPKSPHITTVNTSYVKYHRDDVELLHSASLGSPSVVQAGVPHNIVNSTEDRYCISLVLASVKNNKPYRPTMQESLHMLSKYLG